METLGTLYTLGYVASGAQEQLDVLMEDPSMLLVDVRYAARSRWYREWHKGRLVEMWGHRYLHERRLGNVNYQNRRKPIELLDAEGGVAMVVELLQQGYSVVLLCACTEYQRCHRRIVAELVGGGGLQRRRAARCGGAGVPAALPTNRRQGLLLTLIRVSHTSTLVAWREGLQKCGHITDPDHIQGKHGKFF